MGLYAVGRHLGRSWKDTPARASLPDTAAQWGICRPEEERAERLLVRIFAIIHSLEIK